MAWWYGILIASGCEVEQAGHERADHEAVAGERLVHRRRLVQAPDDRLEVVDAAAPTGTGSRPSRRRRRVGARGRAPTQPAARAHEHRRRRALLEQRLGRGPRRRARSTARPRGTGRARCGTWPGSRRGPVPVMVSSSTRSAAGDDPTVRRRPRDDDVVAGTDGQRAEHAVERRRARLHEDELVAGGVAVRAAVDADSDDQATRTSSLPSSSRRSRPAATARCAGGAAAAAGSRGASPARPRAGSMRTIALGDERWYSSDDAPLKPSVPISSSAASTVDPSAAVT